MASLPFLGCDAREERENIVFCFPSSKLKRNPTEVADNLQAAFTLLATQFPAPHQMDYRRCFSQDTRILIGYRRGTQHASDGQPVDENADVDPGYYHPEHRVNVPWDYLDHGENSHGFDANVAFQPEYCCGHELGHPFESVGLDGNPNQGEWKEGICDFTRLVLLKEWGQRDAKFGPICHQYEQYLLSVDPTGRADDSNERRYHFAARLILEWFTKNNLSLELRHLRQLFDGDMTKILGSWRDTGP